MPTWLWVIIVNSIVLALAGYIWKNMVDRVREMEKSDKLETEDLIKHPLLTVESHSSLCTKNSQDMRSFVESLTTLLGTKMEEGEKRTGLLIENAILRSFKNGKNGKGKKK